MSSASEHAAWDCSSVPSRVASLLRHWIKHLDGDKAGRWSGQVVIGMVPVQDRNHGNRLVDVFNLALGG